MGGYTLVSMQDADTRASGFVPDAELLALMRLGAGDPDTALGCIGTLALMGEDVGEVSCVPRDASELPGAVETACEAIFGFGGSYGDLDVASWRRRDAAGAIVTCACILVGARIYGYYDADVAEAVASVREALGMLTHSERASLREAIAEEFAWADPTLISL